MCPLDNNGKFDWNRAFTRLSSEKTPAGAQHEELLLETYKIKLPPMTPLKISPEQPQEIDHVSLNILKQCNPGPFSSYVPIVILGDGNCMYRALSMGLYGTQDHHQHIRMLTSIEMLKYREFYDAESTDFNDPFNDDQLVFGKYHDLIRDATELGRFSEMMHILAASAALHVPIQTYCPTLNFLIPSEPFTKTVYGRGVSKLLKADVILMWTTSSPIDLINHFVILLESEGPLSVLLESEGPLSDELRDNDDDDMISQTDDSTEHRPNFAPTPQEVASCKINPEYLHTNGMVHTWIFSAFGEIIDNANDPDVMAEKLWIDKVDIDNFPCLTFKNDGAGMDRAKLYKMLSLGFCEKKQIGTHIPIGRYGCGFKSGSMRIGRDALVFTKSEKTASIGFLSQTYNKAVKADSILLPMISYSWPGLEPFENQQPNLEAILQHSNFDTEAKLKDQLNSFEGTGTKIVIFNLHRLKNNSKIFELDFSSDPKDIRCPESFEVDPDSPDDRPLVPNRTDYKISLKEYCCIHFRKPRMKIFVRGERVKRRSIEYSLAHVHKDQYKPAGSKRSIPITFGLTCDKERSEEYGMMIYNRNRLVRAFERVGCQKKGDGRGKGVIGIVEVNFLQAIHDKQNFAVDSKYNALMKACAQKLNDYWDAMYDIERPQTEKPRELTWVQCDNCDKYRRLPDHVNPETLPDEWYCRMNLDATHNRCEIPEEPQEETIEELALKETIAQKRRSKRNKRGGESQTSQPAKKRKSWNKSVTPFKVRIESRSRLFSSTNSSTLSKSVTPSKDNDTGRRETRSRPPSSTNLSTLSTLGESLSNKNDSVIDLTDDDVNNFKVPKSVTIKTEPFLSGLKNLSANCTTTSLNMDLETNQLANDDDDSENSSLFLARTNTSSLSNISQSEGAENNPEIDELDGGDDSALNGENEMQDTEGETVLEGNQDVSDESRQSNSGSPQLVISTSEYQDIDGGNTSQISPSIGTEINPPMEEISENLTSATQREEGVSKLKKSSPSNSISHDFLIERLEQAELERDEYATKLQRLKKNVYRLLQLLAPKKDLGDVDNVNELVEFMIREKSQSVDSPDL